MLLAQTFKLPNKFIEEIFVLSAAVSSSITQIIKKSSLQFWMPMKSVLLWPVKLFNLVNQKDMYFYKILLLF